MTTKVSRHFVLGNAERPRLRREVLRILETHRGEQSAITGNTMANILGMPDDRKIRVVIDELITEGEAIAASSSGFFMVETSDEAFKYITVLKGRRDEIDKRLRAFEEAVAKGGISVPEQGAMRL